MTTQVRSRSPRAARAPAVDPACAQAIDLARGVAEELAAPGEVGEHLGVHAEDDRVVTHYFRCADRAYVGWQWAVTLARASRAKQVTVAEAALLPGPDAMLAPEWLPWSERLRPGDLGVGDLLPTRADDERLEPGFLGGEIDEDDELASVVRDLKLGRARVLSTIGRDDAVDRWYSGPAGPTAPIAEAAPAVCSSCGFLWRLRGSMGRIFGVCTNEYAPDDGRVVSVDHGCGAHSEAAVMPTAPEVAGPRVDEVGWDLIAIRPLAHDPGSVDAGAPAEDLGHS